MERYFEIVRNISQEQVDTFCACVNDWNPIHRPDYPTPMVPGMLTATLMLENPEPMWVVAKLEHKFSSPAYIGKDLVYKYTVVHDRSTKKKFEIEVVQDDRVCLTATGVFIKIDQ